MWIKRLPIPSITGSTYTLYIEYDSTNHRFIFRNGTEETIFGPPGLPPRDRDPNILYKGLSTRIRINDPNSSGYVSATFDNVYKNGALYDDFSSPIIDSKKWTTYEYSMEITGGKFRSKTSSASTTTVPNFLYFVSPSSINSHQAKVTLLAYQNDQGTYTTAGISGVYYNDGTPGGGLIGDVGAQCRIGGSEINPVGVWGVWKNIGQPPGENPESLASGTFTIPISLGNTYTLFLGWDGSKFTFRINDEEAYYVPATKINPPKNLFKRIGTEFWRPAGREATIEALFDDVMVEQVVEDISLSAPLNASVFDCCSLSTPPIFGWSSEESFKGYEIQFSPNEGFGSIPVKMKAKVSESTNEVALPAASWKKVLTMPGDSGGTAYWRVQGKRKTGRQASAKSFGLG